MSLSSEGVEETNKDFNTQILGTLQSETVNPGYSYFVNENSQSTTLEHFIKIQENNHFL